MMVENAVRVRFASVSSIIATSEYLTTSRVMGSTRGSTRDFASSRGFRIADIELAPRRLGHDPVGKFPDRRNVELYCIARLEQPRPVLLLRAHAARGSRSKKVA